MGVSATIKAQRERIDAVLAAQPGSTDQAPAEPTPQIRRAVTLQSKLDAIEAGAAQRQIDVFGPRDWAGQFDRLHALEVAPGSRFTAEKLAEVIWKALPNCSFKRFQEVFTEPGDRIVPKCSVQSINGRRVVTFATDPRRASVLPCIVHIDRVPEALLERLGIADFSGLKGQPVARIERKADVAVLTTLKRAWDSAGPVDRRSHRVGIIGRADGNVDARYDPYPLPEAARGLLLVVRQPGEEAAIAGFRGIEAPSNRELQVQVFESPADALRRFHHISVGYEGEIEQLVRVQDRLKEVHGALSSWRQLSPEGRAELRTKVDEVVHAAVAELAGSHDFGKKRAAELVARAGVTDSRQHDNPPRAQLVLMQTIEKLRGRLERARGKEGYLRLDERALQATRLEAHETLQGYSARVRAAGQVLEQRLDLFGGQILPGRIAVESAHLLAQLDLEPDRLRRLDVRPYSVFGAALAERYGRFAAAVRRADRDGAEDALVRLHVVLKVCAVVWEIEQMKLKLARDPAVTFEGIADSLSGVLARFEGRGLGLRRVFANRVVAGLGEPFNHARAGLREVYGEVTTAGIAKLKGESTPASAAAKMATLREKLDEFSRGGRFDLEKVLERLP